MDLMVGVAAVSSVSTAHRNLDAPPNTFSIKRLLIKHIHVLNWLPDYSGADFLSDLIAGLTVGLTMIPQSIAYANIAGLPAQYGLYTSFVGSFAYIFFGTIKEVSIGPTTLMSMLTISYTSDLDVDYVVLLTFLSGVIELFMGALKLGFLVEFISPCVTSGFTSSMAVVLTTLQLKNLFGLSKLSGNNIFAIIRQVVERVHEIRLGDTVLGLVCMVVLYAFKQLPRIPSKSRTLRRVLWLLSISRNVIIAFVCTVLVFVWQIYSEPPFKLSGQVPSGLPSLRLPNFGDENATFVEMVHRLGTGVLVVPLSAVLANVAIAKAFANGRVVDATQEMISLGMCNIFGSFVQAMPSCGAFTRSAVASNCDVRTPLQGLFSGLVIIMALSFLTPYFSYIPKTALGAILISAVVTLFDYGIFPKLWRCNKFDFFLTLITLLMGCIFGLEIGILSGGLLNLVVLLKIWARPTIITQIRTDQTSNTEYIYIRPELGVYYPLVDYLSNQVAKAHQQAPHLPIRIDCSNVLRLDYAGREMLRNLMDSYKQKSVKFDLLNVRRHIWFKIKKGTSTVTATGGGGSEQIKSTPDTPLLIDHKGRIRNELSYASEV